MSEHKVELSRLLTLKTALLVVVHENDVLQLIGDAGRVPRTVHFRTSEGQDLSLAVTAFEDGRWMVSAMGWELLRDTAVAEWSISMDFAPTYDALLQAGCYRTAHEPIRPKIAGKILVVSRRRSRLVHGLMAPGVILALAIFLAQTAGHTWFSVEMRVALMAAVPPLVAVLLSWRDRRTRCWWRWGLWFSSFTSVLAFVWTTALIRDAHYVRTLVAETITAQAPTTAPEAVRDLEMPDEIQPIMTAPMPVAPQSAADRIEVFSRALVLFMIGDQYAVVFAHPWAPVVPWLRVVLESVQRRTLVGF